MKTHEGIMKHHIYKKNLSEDLMSRVIRKSKSKCIQDYFRITSSRRIKLTRSYAGLCIAVLLAAVGIVIAVVSGGLGKGGIPCFMLYVSAFLLAIVSVCKLFKILLDDRDAKRFIEERIEERSGNALSAAQEFHNLTPIDDTNTYFIIHGYYPNIVNNAPCTFYRDDTNDVYCNHYECNVLIMHKELLYWYSSRFELDTPLVVYEESGDVLSYQDIDYIRRQEYVFEFTSANKEKITSYPFLDICLSSGNKLHFSMAYFSLFSEKIINTYDKEFQGLTDLVFSHQKKLNADND